MGELGLQLRFHPLQRRFHFLAALRFVSDGVMIDDGIVQLCQQRKGLTMRKGVLSGEQQGKDEKKKK